MMAWFGRTAEIAVGKTSLLACAAACVACVPVSDLAVMARFDAVINGPDYQKTAHFGPTGDLSTGDGTQGIDILQPTYEVAANARRLSIEMPISGQHIEGSFHP